MHAAVRQWSVQRVLHARRHPLPGRVHAPVLRRQPDVADHRVQLRLCRWKVHGDVSAWRHQILRPVQRRHQHLRLERVVGGLPGRRPARNVLPGRGRRWSREPEQSHHGLRRTGRILDELGRLLRLGSSSVPRSDAVLHDPGQLLVMGLQLRWSGGAPDHDQRRQLLSAEPPHVLAGDLQPQFLGTLVQSSTFPGLSDEGAGLRRERNNDRVFHLQSGNEQPRTS